MGERNAEYENRTAMKVTSPGKTVYHHMEKVKSALKKRKMDLCLEEGTESSTQSSGSEYTLGTESPKLKRQNVERQFFVADTAQVSD